MGLERVMNKKREKMIALVLMAYGIGLLIGEALRETLYRGKKAEAVLRALHSPETSTEALSKNLCPASPKDLEAV